MITARVLLKVRFEEPKALYQYGFNSSPTVGDVFMHDEKRHTIVERIWKPNGALDVIIELERVGVVKC